MNKKLIKEEINNIKYLLEYKKGKVVSEQKYGKLNEELDRFALEMVFIGGLGPFMRYFGHKLGEFIVHSAIGYQDRKDFKKLFNKIKSNPDDFKLTYEKSENHIDMLIQSNNDLGSIHYTNIELPISFSINTNGGVVVTYMSEDEGEQEISFNMGKKAYHRIEQLTDKFGEGVSEDEGGFPEKIDESGYEDLKSRVNKDKEISTKAHKFGENFSKLIKATLGDAKPLVSEQSNDQNTHRYDKGEQSPGIEKFLDNPSDEKISTGLLNQLRNDPFGKGKIVIIFNGEKFKEPGSFLFKIQSDSKAGKCYEITNYEYNNRFILNTQIKITANGVECKKTTEPIKTSGGTTPIKTADKNIPKPQPKPKPVKCKFKISDINPKVILSRTGIWFGFGDSSEVDYIKLQKYCKRNNLWSKELADGQVRACSDKSIDGKHGCCTESCYRKIMEKPQRVPTYN